MARDKKIPMTVHLPGELVAALKAEQLGDTFSHVVTDRLNQSFKMGERQTAPASPMDDLDLRKKAAEVAVAEQRAAILKGEYVEMEVALEVIGRNFADIRSRILQIPFRIQSLTPEQLADADAAVQDCLTDLSGTKPETWDDLAKQTMENFK